MSDSDNKKNPKLPKINVKKYTIRVAEKFYQKIDHHTQVMKRENHSYNKQSLITAAILEKLATEEHAKPHTLSKDKFLQMYIDKHLDERVDKLIDRMREVQPTFTKKRWLEDALQTKLEKDSPKVASLVKKLKS